MHISKLNNINLPEYSGKKSQNKSALISNEQMKLSSLPTNPIYWQSANMVSFGSNFGGYEINELEQMHVGCPVEIYNSSLDRQTKKMSPTARRVINVFYKDTPTLIDYTSTPTKVRENYLELLKTKPQVFDLFDMEKNEVPMLIDSLKDKNGNFSVENESFLYSLMSASVPYYLFEAASPKIFAEIINVAKNSDGVVDKKRADFAFGMYKNIANLALLKKNLTKYYEIPEDSRQDIYQKLTSCCPSKTYGDFNFATFANYCLNDKHEIIPDRFEFCEKFKNVIPLRYPEKLFDLAKNYPELKDFIFIFSESVEYSETNMLEKYIKENIRDNGTIDPVFKYNLLDFVQFAHTSHPFDYFYGKCVSKDTQQFDSKVFYDALNLMRAEKSLMSGNNIIGPDLAVEIANGSFDVNSCEYQKKILLLNSLNSIKDFKDVQHVVMPAISKLEESFSLNNVQRNVTQASKINFVDNVLASSKNKYTEFEQTIVDSIEYFENNPQGLKLAYPRVEFLKDFANSCSSKHQINKIAKKMNISPLFDSSNQIYGYSGVINLSGLNQDNETEKKVYDLAYKFLYQNSVCTDNEKLNKSLNYIIKAAPEFINTIGRVQHGIQKYSLDIHSLLVLAYSMQHEDYLTKLSSSDKKVLKMATIFHDIGKKECSFDPLHQHASVLFLTPIANDIFPSPKENERLINLVTYHHWLEEFNTSEFKNDVSKKIAFYFRRQNDFQLAKIMAQADLKGVNLDFYEQLKTCLEDDFLSPIEKNIDYIYKTGNLICPNTIIDKTKLKKCKYEHNGHTYKVIDLKKISDNADMSKFGFEKGTKKSDLALLVHMVNNENLYADLASVKLMNMSTSGGILSESLITPNHANTYLGREYGVLLSQDNLNIASMDSENRMSGYKKSLTGFVDLIFNPQGSEQRNYFRNAFLKSLEINPDSVSDEDFAKFYKRYLVNTETLSDINLQGMYVLGKNIISGIEVKKAIIDFQKSLINKNNSSHNEIVGYAPKVEALVSKVKHFSQLPEEFLEFARNNDLPIILI